MIEYIRTLVSQDKQRFIDHDFNLDLTYITSRIVAMSYPSSGFESTYRNSIEEVYRFIQQRHNQQYLVMNLSSRYYDYRKLGGHHKVWDCRWEDHQAPTLYTLFQGIDVMFDFLQQDINNVVFVHCNAGKGRTGTIICSFLMFVGGLDNSLDARYYYSYKRFNSFRRGVTQPSQVRYIAYFKEVLDHLAKSNNNNNNNNNNNINNNNNNNDNNDNNNDNNNNQIIQNNNNQIIQNNNNQIIQNNNNQIIQNNNNQIIQNNNNKIIQNNNNQIIQNNNNQIIQNNKLCKSNSQILDSREKTNNSENDKKDSKTIKFLKSNTQMLKDSNNFTENILNQPKFINSEFIKLDKNKNTNSCNLLKGRGKYLKKIIMRGGFIGQPYGLDVIKPQVRVYKVENNDKLYDDYLQKKEQKTILKKGQGQGPGLDEFTLEVDNLHLIGDFMLRVDHRGIRSRRLFQLSLNTHLLSSNYLTLQAHQLDPDKLYKKIDNTFHIQLVFQDVCQCQQQHQVCQQCRPFQLEFKQQVEQADFIAKVAQKNLTLNPFQTKMLLFTNPCNDDLQQFLQMKIVDNNQVQKQTQNYSSEEEYAYE